jgi:HPr kinase/phosphorylase
VGESGVGKSETAVELLKRGHKLISDDLVEIRKISKNSLIGSAPENIRHFIEVRGIGIINARRIFGIGAVKLSEKIDIVINLETWQNNKMYNRLGSTVQYIEILDIKVPYITIPVRPGRNLAVIIEVAAMNNRQRKMGYNAARELFITLDMKYPEVNSEMEKCVWDI